MNFDNYIQLDSETWVQGIVLPGEGLYGCANRGTCIAPDNCSCADGCVFAFLFLFLRTTASFACSGITGLLSMVKFYLPCRFCLCPVKVERF